MMSKVALDFHLMVQSLKYIVRNNILSTGLLSGCLSVPSRVNRYRRIQTLETLYGSVTLALRKNIYDVRDFGRSSTTHNYLSLRRSPCIHFSPVVPSPAAPIVDYNYFGSPLPPRADCAVAALRLQSDSTNTCPLPFECEGPGFSSPFPSKN
jgi:hypothetical protein